MQISMFFITVIVDHFLKLLLSRYKIHRYRKLIFSLAFEVTFFNENDPNCGLVLVRARNIPQARFLGFLDVTESHYSGIRGFVFREKGR